MGGGNPDYRPPIQLENPFDSVPGFVYFIEALLAIPYWLMLVLPLSESKLDAKCLRGCNNLDPNCVHCPDLSWDRLLFNWDFGNIVNVGASLFLCGSVLILLFSLGLVYNLVSSWKELSAPGRMGRTGALLILGLGIALVYVRFNHFVWRG